MHRWKLLLPILLLGCFGVLLAHNASAAIVPGSLKYQTIHTKHFRLHFPNDYDEIGQKVAGLLEEMHGLLGQEFNVYPKGKVEVVLTDQYDVANGFATVIPYNLMILRIVPPAADSSLAYYDDWLRLLVAHEYTHILNLSDAGYPAKLLKFLLGKIVSPNALTPTWISEGMATYYESAITGYGRGRSSYGEMILRTDIIRNAFLPIDKAAGSMYDWPSWQAGYLYGVGFWNYLSKTYGKETVTKFSHKYGGTLWFFTLNNKAKRVFGKSFYKLWKEWRSELQTQYQSEREQFQAGHPKRGEAFIAPKRTIVTAPAWSLDGQTLAYVSTSPKRAAEVRLKDAEGDRLLFKNYAPGQLSWSPDGQTLAFTTKGDFKQGFQFNDLYEYSFATKKVKPITRGKRTRDASFAPDGQRIALSVHEKNRDRLGIYNRNTKELTLHGQTPKNTRIDHLDWSPTNARIAASVWHQGGSRQIVVYDDKGHILRTISSGQSQALYPRWSANGDQIYYSSDRNGIYNLYRYNWRTRKTAQLTNVLTGAFAPSPVSGSHRVTYQYYNGDGYELREISADSAQGVRLASIVKQADTTPLLPEASEESPPPFRLETDYQQKNYSPLSPALLPHYLQPNFAFLDNALFLNLFTGSQDALGRHAWYASANYRTDAQFIGFGGGYRYGRYATKLFVGFADFAVNFGNIFGLGPDFFEERRRGFIGVGRSFSGGHGLSLAYFFEERSAESAIPAGATFLPVLGNFAGLSLNYTWRDLKKYAAAISPEDSYRLRASIDFSNSVLGASNTMEQMILSLDARQYVEMPWNHKHVLAFRQAGGIALGDTLTQGTFAIGGSLGESPIVAASTRVFTLRGLPLSSFLRDRAMVLSAEYRMPLFETQRGLGTTPFFLNQASIAFFADYGNAWNKGQTPGGFDFFDPFLLGVGAELRGHFVLAYHLPIMGRLGYGIIVVNKGRVSRLTDPILGQTINNGILILEFGTSF